MHVGRTSLSVSGLRRQFASVGRTGSGKKACACYVLFDWAPFEQVSNQWPKIQDRKPSPTNQFIYMSKSASAPPGQFRWAGLLRKVWYRSYHAYAPLRPLQELLAPGVKECFHQSSVAKSFTWSWLYFDLEWHSDGVTHLTFPLAVASLNQPVCAPDNFNHLVSLTSLWHTWACFAKHLGA